ncbi:MAG: hypothetical protein LQ340_005053 [Diploschistes diacapsis]|nr:MAG: hypothetical protein LQ340_005053 [Diploschistes diacapsis]
MSTYLITGCSRGLGLALVKELVHSPSSSLGLVLATARSPQPPPALAEQIEASNGRAHYISLDVLSEASISAAVDTARSILGPDRHLDVLFNNAAIVRESTNNTKPDTTPYNLSAAALRATLDTNVLAVASITSAFLPLLRANSGHGKKKIINVTSTLGSLTLNPYLKQIAVPHYKISKTALNALTVQQANALEGEGFCVLALSPGHLRTELGGEGAGLSAEQGAKAVMEVVRQVSKEDNGTFRNINIEGNDMYNGENVAW